MADDIIDPSRSIIVTFPDDLKLDKNLPYKVAEAHLQGREYACIATDVMVPGTKYQYGESRVDERGIVVKRVEKPFVRKNTSIGVYVFDPEAMKMLFSYTPYTDFETTLLEDLYRQERLYSCRLPRGIWVPVNDDKGYHEARQELARRNGVI